jgi:putative polysaccharide biosynthesis protein
MQTALPLDKALLVAPLKPKAPASQIIVEVARKYHVSPFRQLREMLSLKWGPGKLEIHDYYSSGCFNPDLTADQKREFVGEKGSFKLNTRMSPIRSTPARVFIRDKVMYCALLKQLGLRTTETQAVVLKARSYGNIPALRDVDDIKHFLVNTAAYPIFGKPVEGSKSVGSALIKGIDSEAGLLLLSNGQKVDIGEFANEVFEGFESGYIFQSAVDQHPDMQRMTGDAVGTLRVVTVRDENGVEPLYSAWKIPSPTAMSDNFWQAGSMVAQLDNATGKVVKCKRGSGLEAEWIDAHPVKGEVFAGYQIPHWEATRELAVHAHELFPEFGIFGWDIAVTRDGPLIIECNANPFHTLYQISTGRGILNEKFNLRFAAAADCSNLMFRAKIDAAKARK